MLFWLIVLVVVGFAAYKLRAPLLARILGQPESRVRREITHKKDR